MDDTKHFTVDWVDYQREPTCDPNPAYPDGIDLDASRGQQPTCRVTLPYPAKRRGLYVLACRVCGMTAACTTAGRTDDPRSITLHCKLEGRTQ